ncbi:DMT family transporter [Aestuariivirga sp.]|uniref:DMT family transporter n=1 Tax=Aestuariivirga sp. TaxID=2650926 RepID=UPI0039E4C5F7
MGDGTVLQSRARAALFVVGSVGLASMQDAIMKGVSGSLPAYEAVIFRTISSLPLLFTWLLITSSPANLFPPRLLPMLVLRSFILCTAYFGFVLSIATLPLATSVSIYFTMPFFVAALAGWALGERVPRYRWIAIIIGFGGVMLMVRPGSEAFQPAALYALWSAVGYAIGQMIGRHLSLRVEPVVIANWQNLTYFSVALLIGLIGPHFASASITDKSLLFLLRPWVWPDTHQLILLILMGMLSALASAGFIFAYRTAEANFVAPFEYTALLWAICNGIVFFGDFPDSSTWSGAVIVIGAGIWMLWKDRSNRPAGSI